MNENEFYGRQHQLLSIHHVNPFSSGGNGRGRTARRDARVHLRVARTPTQRDSHSFYTIIFPLSKYQPVNTEVISEVAKCTPPAAAWLHSSAFGVDCLASCCSRSSDPTSDGRRATPPALWWTWQRCCRAAVFARSLQLEVSQSTEMITIIPIYIIHMELGLHIFTCTIQARYTGVSGSIQVRIHGFSSSAWFCNHTNFFFFSQIKILFRI